jgi:hypothetical protein
LTFGGEAARLAPVNKPNEELEALAKRVQVLEDREREREQSAVLALAQAQEAFKREGILGMVKGLMKMGKGNGEART